MDVYNNMDGNAVGTLTFNVSDINVLAFPRRKGDAGSSTGAANGAAFNAGASGNNTTTPDDLPF